MTLLFYICIAIGCVVAQTAFFPMFTWLGNFYDLLIPLVVYLGLFRPLKEGLPAVFCMGFAMDTLSGGAFGIYSTTYFWLYAAIVWLIGFVHFKNNLLLPFIVVVGVFLENIIFWGAVRLASPAGPLPAGTLHTGGVQILWALFTGPPLLFMIRTSHQGLLKWRAEALGEGEL